jgi:hypothetical protein
MQTRISLLQIFYDAYCNANGKLPNCSGCEYYGRTMTKNPVCTYPEHPERKEAHAH